MSKSSELDKNVKLYLLSVIDGDIDGTRERFESEVRYNIKIRGPQAALTDWLQGLALDIAYNNHEIIELAKQWRSLPESAGEKQEDKILDNYWSFMAVKLMQLFNGYRVPKI